MALGVMGGLAQGAQLLAGSLPSSVLAVVTSDYDMPNQQSPTQLFYHDHVMGVTRIGLYSGVVGTAYFIRDPNNPLDASNSPLPKRQFEIPLPLPSTPFYTPPNLHFPPTIRSLTPLPTPP